MYFDYANILVFLLAGMAFVFLNMLVGALLRPKRGTEAGLEPYECGEEVIGDAWFRFDIRYYTVALVYIVFAVEVAFLFPWARVLKEAVLEPGIGVAALGEGFLFVAILLLGLAYVWAKGDLSWVKSIGTQPGGGSLAAPPDGGPAGARRGGAPPVAARGSGAAAARPGEGV